MSWTTQRSWADGDIVTAAWLNTYLRDALRYLKASDGQPVIEDSIDLKDMDGTPVGNLRLKVIDGILQIRNDDDNAYKYLKVDSIPTGSTSATVALGNHTHTIAEDTTNTGVSATGQNSHGVYKLSTNIAASADYDLATSTQTYAAGSRTAGVAWAFCGDSAGATLKLGLIMNGVLIAESSTISSTCANYVVVGSAALSGSKDCVARVHNYHASTTGTLVLVSLETTGEGTGASIAVGSVKFP